MPRHLPNMTATEVREAKKAYFAEAAAKESLMWQPLIERMLEIFKEQGLTTDADCKPSAPRPE